MKSARPSSLLPSFQRVQSRVAIRRAESYQQDLGALVFETLREFNLPVSGKTVLLKPNFVGLDPLGVTNTHPAVIRAARESFLRLGAQEVLVADGPALERDTEAILDSIRLDDYDHLTKYFVDLNVDEVYPVSLQTRASALEAALPSRDASASRLCCFNAQVEDSSLVWRHAFSEEHVWNRPRELLRLAQEYSPLGGNHAGAIGY